MLLTAELEETVLSLPSKDRAALAMRLMDSLNDEAWADEDILTLAETRDEELENDAVKALSHEEFLSGLHHPKTAA